MMSVISQKWYFVCRCWDMGHRVEFRELAPLIMFWRAVLSVRRVSWWKQFNSSSSLICSHIMVTVINPITTISQTIQSFGLKNVPDWIKMSVTCGVFFLQYVNTLCEERKKITFSRYSVVLMVCREKQHSPVTTPLPLSIPEEAILNGAADVVKVSKHFQRLNKFDCSSLCNLEIHLPLHT